MRNIAKLEAELECLDVYNNGEPINSFDQGWSKIILPADSGAAEHVMNKNTVPGITKTPSNTNLEYVAADGSPVPNEGCKNIKFMTEEGANRSIMFQVAPVRKPFAS